MEEKKPKCMICNQQKEGINIRQDSVVSAIRWLNSKTFKYSNPYRPVICRDCFLRHRKLRQDFEHKRIAYLVIGFIFLVVLIIASRGNPVSILAGIGVVAFMYLLALISYVPALDIPEQREQQAAATRPKEHGKRKSRK